MSLFSNLSIGSQALMSFQKGIDVANKNMTNVYTEGYKREVPVFSNFPTQGVDFAAAKRVYDDRLLDRYIQTNQNRSYYESYSSSLSSMEQVFNDISGTGFAGALDNFFLSMNDVITAPDNLASRDSFLYAAQSLTGRIRDSYEALQNQKETNHQSIKDNVSELNDKLKSLASINQTIKNSIGNDSTYNSALNQRDLLLEEISSLVDTKVRFNADGTVDLFSAKGYELVLYDKASTLSVKTEQQNVTVTDPDTGDTLSYNIFETRVSINNVDLTSEFTKGKIGAKLQYEKDLDESIKSLNTFTFKFAREVNSIQTAGFDLNGNAGIELFANENGGTANIDASNIILNFDDPALVAAATDPTNIQSDNVNIKNLQNLQDMTYAVLNNQSFNEYYNSQLVAKSGLKKSHADNLFAENDALLESINTKMEELSGVNMDEELIRLTQLQRSYEASARIITVTDELLQTVLGLVR